MPFKPFKNRLSFRRKYEDEPSSIIVPDNDLVPITREDLESIDPPGSSKVYFTRTVSLPADELPAGYDHLIKRKAGKATFPAHKVLGVPTSLAIRWHAKGYGMMMDDIRDYVTSKEYKTLIDESREMDQTIDFQPRRTHRGSSGMM